MWIIFALLAGLGDALRDAFSKKASSSVPRSLISWSYALCALPFFLPVLLSELPDHFPPFLWLLLGFVTCCHVIGGLMLVKALQLSDLSLCMPMMAFTPVFLLVVAPLLAGDAPSRAGVVGATLVTLGSYVLNVDKVRVGIMAPFRALLRDNGPRIMLGLSLLWTITACVDRVVVQIVDRAFWGSAQLCGIALAMFPVVVRQGGLSRPLPRGSYLWLLSIGGCNALSLGAYLFALHAAPVHHVVCLKRVSILFSVILGRMLFRERFLSERLPGALMMLAGVVVITLFS
ncbi:MAG: hypothetical protein RL518_497 [Pseudomonadota bacterium]|jgi:drug/metabolite transporter (DMT)-like permease